MYCRDVSSVLLVDIKGLFGKKYSRPFLNSLTESQSATLGVGLFYLASLLPDPDHPYEVSTVNCHMWLISLVYETAWLLVKISSQPIHYHGITALDATQIALASSRVLIFFSMIALYLTVNRQTYCEVEENNGERESLLGKPGKRVGDAQNTTWLDYLLGFRKLFPFLW